MPENLTAEQFVEWRLDDVDGGRWSELVDGRTVTFDPPEPMHGTVALNLSKAVAEFVQREPDAGCAAFDLGLVVGREPDSVQVPTLSWFPGEDRFQRTGDDLCDTVPGFVADVVSTPSRRRLTAERVAALHEWGVHEVWILDVEAGLVHTSVKGGPAVEHGAGTVLESAPAGCRLRLEIDRLFAEPDWWSG